MKNFRVAQTAIRTIIKNMKLSMTPKSVHQWYLWVYELKHAPRGLYSKKDPVTWVNIVQVQRMLRLKQKRRVTTTQQYEYELLILKFLTLECICGDHRRYGDDTIYTNV